MPIIYKDKISRDIGFETRRFIDDNDIETVVLEVDDCLVRHVPVDDLVVIDIPEIKENIYDLLEPVIERARKLGLTNDDITSIFNSIIRGVEDEII